MNSRTRASGFTPFPADHPDADRIHALDEAWAAAAARRDLDGMMAIYAPDAQELLPASPAIVGREAIRQFYAGLIERFPRFAHHFELESITWRRAGTWPWRVARIGSLRTR